MLHSDASERQTQSDSMLCHRVSKSQDLCVMARHIYTLSKLIQKHQHHAAYRGSDYIHVIC
jgi:hypothetical protein